MPKPDTSNHNTTHGQFGAAKARFDHRDVIENLRHFGHYSRNAGANAPM